MSTHDDRQQALDTLNGDDAMPGEYCLECHNLGFVIMGNNDRNKVERCDTCRRFDDDEEATKALDQFIAKHAPPAPAEPRKASNGSEIVTMVDLLPTGCKTPEGNARLAKAMEEFNNAKAEMANYFAGLCRDCAGGSGNLQNQARSIARRLNDRANYVEVSMEELTELLQRHQDAQEDFMNAVAGQPTKAERETERKAANALPTCVASAIYQATASQHDAMVIAWRYLSPQFSKPRYIAAPGSSDDYAIRAMRAAHDEFTNQRTLAPASDLDGQSPAGAG